MPSILVATGFVRIDADTKPALKALKSFGAIGGNLLTTTIGPASAAAVTAIGAVASAAAVAGAAASAYGVAVGQQFSQVKEAATQQKAAQDAQTKATNATALAQQLAREGGFKYGEQVKITAGMTDTARQRAESYNRALSASKSATMSAQQSQQAYKAQLSQMPPATATLTEALQKLKDDTKAWSDSMAGSTMPIFTRAVEFLDRLLPKLSPIVRDVAKEIDAFSLTLGEGAAGKVFREFGQNVTENGAGALRTFLDIARNLVVGIGGILNAFTPMAAGVTGGLEDMTAKFADWGANLGGSKGFGKFIDLAREAGPKLVDLFKALASAFVDVASAAGPMAGVGLTLITILAQLIDAIPTGVLQLLVPVILAINTGMKLYAVYTSAAAAATWLFSTANGASNVQIAYQNTLLFILWVRIKLISLWQRIVAASTLIWTLATSAQGRALALQLVQLALVRAAMLAQRVAMAIATAAQWAWNAAMSANPIGLVILAIAALVAAIVWIALKTTWFQDIWKVVWDFMKSIGRWFSGPFVDFFTKTIPRAFRWLMDWVKANWPWLLGALTGPIGLAVVWIIKHWDTVKDKFKSAWDFIYKWTVQPWITFFGTTLPNAAKAFKEKVLGWMGNLRDGLKAVWDWIYKNVIKPNVQVWTQTLPNAARTLKDKVVGFWNSLRDGVSGVFRGIKDRVFSPMGDFFTKKIPGWAGTMRDKVKSFFGQMRDGIGTIWNGIKDKTKTPVNWVLDHVWNRGIRSIWGKITGWIGIKNTLGRIKLLASGGTVGNQPFGMFNRPTAIVGEGNPMYPEYVIPTDPRYRGRARRLWEMAGGHFMKDGGILGSIGDWLGSAASAVGGTVSGTLDFFTDPVGKAKKLLNGAFKGAETLGRSPWAQMALRLPHMAVDGLIKAVKDNVGSVLGAIGLGPSGGSGVQRWKQTVLLALRMVGQVPALVDITLRRMNQESGGNPTIVNKWDSNWKAGHPSVGLMQVIGPTFRAYAGKMRGTGPFLYGVSVNPLANIYASMRYALAAYGSLSRAYGRAGGYRNGTTSAAGGFHLFGENGPEMGFSPAGWRILNSRRTAGLGGGTVIERLVLENHGVIGSQREVENWLVETLTTLKRKGRTP